MKQYISTDRSTITPTKPAVNWGKAFRTGAALEALMETSIPRIEAEVQEYLTRYQQDLYDIRFDGSYDLAPYWLETPRANGCLVSYQPGYHDAFSLGEVFIIEGQKYEYIGSQPLPEEIELQADDGGLVYAYVGSHYLRIFFPLD